MQISLAAAGPETQKCDVMVLLANASTPLRGPAALVDRLAGGHLSEVIAAGDFDGKGKSSRLVHTRSGLETKRLLLVGLSGANVQPAESGRLAGGVALQALSGLPIKHAVVTVPDSPEPTFVQGLVEGLLLAAYRFDVHRTTDPENAPPSTATVAVAPAEDTEALRGAVDRGRSLAEAASLARDLVSEPPNALTPSALAERAATAVEAVGGSCQVLGKPELEAERFGALLGVARGSAQDPRFIVMEHVGAEPAAAPLVIVGKGITFDSGGLSLKTAKGMEDMKGDMAGAAAVIGAMQAIGRIGCAQRVIGLVAATENMTGAAAQRPGDVVRSLGGVSIEVLNTDAEGRLVLADALGYAARYKPTAVVDAATLTGAAITALGHHAAPLLGNDDALLHRIERAAVTTGERVWRLPLWPDYDEPLKSKVADIKNIGDGGAGTISGAAFLKRFVSYPWAHLDIAGTAWGVKDVAYLSSQATGYGARLLAELADRWPGPA